MSLQNQKEVSVEPLYLTEEELKDPVQVIHDFFDFAHLPDVREMLWDFLKATVTGNYNKLLSRRERSDMMYFYERLAKVLEAAHLIHVINEKG